MKFDMALGAGDTRTLTGIGKHLLNVLWELRQSFIGAQGNLLQNYLPWPIGKWQAK